MIRVVNGFVCMNGCDVAAARRGADPRNPTRDPVKQEILDRANPAKAAQPIATGSDGLGGRVDIVV